MAESTTKKKDFTIKELLDAYEAAKMFLDESAYIVRTDEKVTPGERARFNFYNTLVYNLKNKLDEKLHEINDIL